jgi:hypothetical protein
MLKKDFISSWGTMCRIMENQQSGISLYSVNLSRNALKQMIAVVRCLQTLYENRSYSALLPELQDTARVNIKHYSVLMGYDFHITEEQQVKLIEVNTNSGGLWLACRSYEPNIEQFPEKLANKLLHTFINEYRLFCKSQKVRPLLIAIVDQQPHTQFLYPEMQIFAKLFQQAGIDTVIIDPSDINAKETGLYYQEQRIDLIYTRHCDFYLQSSEMRVIADAWKNQLVCLTPNPRIYGLLADKQRMVDWSQPGFFKELLSSKQSICLQQAIPYTKSFHTYSRDELWSERKKWVFKPANGYASRGVYVGEKLTKNKFNSLDPQATLVQQRIKPSVTVLSDGERFKTDFRLFVYRDKVTFVSARIYQGQVTNLRTPGGGFSKIRIS